MSRCPTALRPLVAATLLAIAAAAPVHAAVVPVGVQNDISYDTVVNDWGWTLVSRSNYGDSTSIANLFAGLTPDSPVMIAAKQSSSGIIDVLAAATLADVTTYTAQNQVHVANGVSWYFNALSMGFAGLGDEVCQNSADTCGLTERDRLSWHTTLLDNNWSQSSAVAPNYAFMGWRSGSNLWIYGGSDWERLVFTQAANAHVPEPTSLALVALALAAAGVARKRAAA